MTMQALAATDVEPTPADQAREHLATIRKGWPHVLNPMRIEAGGSTTSDNRPATEDERELPPDARLDTPVTLAFWVHAAIDEWPTILERPEHIPQPTTDPDTYAAWTIRMRTITIDCSSIWAMTDLLHREADRITAWVDLGHDYGRTFVTELAALARAVERVAWPPKGDRMVIGDCPACGRRIRVKAPRWHKRPERVPQPTTNPEAYPDWTWIVPEGAEWEPDRDKPITCRCGKDHTLQEWRQEMAGPSLPLTAKQLVADIRQQFGLKYDAATVRQWARRGMIVAVGKSRDGHATYDRTQVLAALMARERKRDLAS